MVSGEWLVGSGKWGVVGWVWGEWGSGLQTADRSLTVHLSLDLIDEGENFVSTL